MQIVCQKLTEIGNGLRNGVAQAYATFYEIGESDLQPCGTDDKKGVALALPVQSAIRSKIIKCLDRVALRMSVEKLLPAKALTH